MSELNPQTSKALKILARSPKVVPAAMCLRVGYAPPFKDKLWVETVGRNLGFHLEAEPESYRRFEQVEKRLQQKTLDMVTAGALVTKDYGAVVERCRQVLATDPSICALILTKNDGFSLVHETGGTTNNAAGDAIALLPKWRTETLGPEWRPVTRSPRGDIETVPLVHRRLLTSAEASRVYVFQNHTLAAAIERKCNQDALVEAKESLESRVRQRTKELEEQVAAKQQALAELSEAQQRLIEASRLAGKAEVATCVLHNVGNVLNSVSVSATIVGDRLRRSKVTNLRRAAAMLREQDGNLVNFLTSDPKGRALPDYLPTICEEIESEQSEMLSEVQQLGHNIEHLKKIVAMQQNYARVAGACEEVQPTELVEDALRMNAASSERCHTTVIREYDALLPRLNVDRHKVLQVLVNLMSNAEHAMDTGAVAQRNLVVGVRSAPAGSIAIRVRDNGIGIPPESLVRIFSLGFTTKRNGHGFGLHSGANAAREMGGRLTGPSDGPGQGAEFTLELPVTRSPEKVTYEQRPPDRIIPGREPSHPDRRRQPFDPRRLHQDPLSKSGIQPGRRCLGSGPLRRSTAGDRPGEVPGGKRLPRPGGAGDGERRAGGKPPLCPRLRRRADASGLGWH